MSMSINPRYMVAANYALLLFICRVLIATGADHRPNGMAFVEFDSPRTAEIALKKHKQMMGSRYVEVFLASVDERARYIPLH